MKKLLTIYLPGKEKSFTTSKEWKDGEAQLVKSIDQGIGLYLTITKTDDKKIIFHGFPYELCEY